MKSGFVLIKKSQSEVETHLQTAVSILINLTLSLTYLLVTRLEEWTF